MILDSFLPQEVADKLHKYVEDLEWTYGWRSNNATGYAHWNNNISKAGPENGLNIEDRLEGAAKEAWEYIKSNHLPDHVLIRCYANAHTHGVEGYPHTDSKRDQDTTVVIYMNKGWKREWGGETLIYDGDRIVEAALPAFNRAVIFNGNQWHSARNVTRICPDLRKTIMFKCARANADVKRDSLQQMLERADANTRKHKFGSLMAHLLNTYDLLKAAGLPDDTCLAGGIHSIFGTNAFKDRCLTYGDRPMLEDLFGKTPVDLAVLFSIIDRASTLENALANKTLTLDLTDGGTITVTQEQLDALCFIEAANLQDQNELTRFKNLKAFWNNGETR